MITTIGKKYIQFNLSDENEDTGFTFTLEEFQDIILRGIKDYRREHGGGVPVIRDKDKVTSVAFTSSKSCVCTIGMHTAPWTKEEIDALDPDSKTDAEARLKIRKIITEELDRHRC